MRTRKTGNDESVSSLAWSCLLSFMGLAQDGGEGKEKHESKSLFPQPFSFSPVIHRACFPKGVRVI